MLVVVARITGARSGGRPPSSPPQPARPARRATTRRTVSVCECIRAMHRTMPSRVAAYRDIAEQLLQRIAAGELAAGSTLPSVRAGARERGTTPATVGRAYAELARAGRDRSWRRDEPRASPATAPSLARRALHGGRALRLAGSDDPLLDRIATGADRVGAPGSFGGLTALWQQRADAATLHLRHRDGGYNDPFAAHILDGRRPVLVHLWRREQGIILPRGNPDGIETVDDLLGRPVALRASGTGTRVLLERLLRDAGADPAALRGPDARTHLEAAVAVAVGPRRRRRRPQSGGGHARARLRPARVGAVRARPARSRARRRRRPARRPRVRTGDAGLRPRRQRHDAATVEPTRRAFPQAGQCAIMDELGDGVGRAAQGPLGRRAGDLRERDGGRGERRGLRGTELGGVVARRRRRGVRSARACLRALQAARRQGRRRADGDLARRRRARLQRRASASRAAGCGRARRLLEPVEEGPEHGWLAFHEGYVARCAGRQRGRGRARCARGAAWDVGSGSPTSRCSGLRWRARRSSRARAWRRACAAWTRRRRPRSRARL